MTVGAVGRDPATEAFFDGAASGRFLLRRCRSGHVSKPQARQCGTCGITELSWDPASGAARLVSWAVIPGREGRDRVVVAIGELDEGIWWWTRLVDADPAHLVEGEPLRIRFESPEGSEAVPVFAPASQAG